MGFHDCGTYEKYAEPQAFGRKTQCGGCNGSFKQEMEDGLATNFCTFPQQNGTQRSLLVCAYNFVLLLTSVHSHSRTVRNVLHMPAHTSLIDGLMP
jgi:hypothetical protein